MVKKITTILFLYLCFNMNAQIKDSLMEFGKPTLRIFPKTKGDSLEFDNIRFLSIYYKDTINKHKRIVDDNRPVDSFYVHINGKKYVSHGNQFDSLDLRKIFYNKHTRLTIDTVFYHFQEKKYTSIINNSYTLSFPHEDKFQYFDSYPITGLRLQVFFHNMSKMKPGSKLELNESYAVSYNYKQIFYKTENVFYRNYFLLDLTMPGTNRITVKDKNQNILYDKIILNRNREMANIFFSPIGETLYITVEGTYHFNIQHKTVWGDPIH